MWLLLGANSLVGLEVPFVNSQKFQIRLIFQLRLMWFAIVEAIHGVVRMQRQLPKGVTKRGCHMFCKSAPLLFSSRL
jgi:hypothetical protein